MLSDLEESLPENLHSWITSHNWELMETLGEALDKTKSRTIKDVISWEARKDCWMYCKSGAIMMFTDNTAYAVIMDGGWSGTEVTAGNPAYTEYFFLTPVVSNLHRH